MRASRAFRSQMNKKNISLSFCRFVLSFGTHGTRRRWKVTWHADCLFQRRKLMSHALILKREKEKKKLTIIIKRERQKMFIVCIEKQLDVMLSASYGEESCALKKNCRGAINQSHETTTIKMVPRHRCRSFLVSKRGKELNRTMRNKSSCHHTSLRPHKT